MGEEVIDPVVLPLQPGVRQRHVAERELPPERRLVHALGQGGRPGERLVKVRQRRIRRVPERVPAERLVPARVAIAGFDDDEVHVGAAGRGEKIGHLARIGGHVDRGVAVVGAVDAARPGGRVQADLRVRRVLADHRDQAVRETGHRIFLPGAVDRVGGRHRRREGVRVRVRLLRVSPQIRLDVEQRRPVADLLQHEAPVGEIAGEQRGVFERVDLGLALGHAARLEQLVVADERKPGLGEQIAQVLTGRDGQVLPAPPPFGRRGAIAGSEAAGEIEIADVEPGLLGDCVGHVGADQKLVVSEPRRHAGPGSDDGNRRRGIGWTRIDGDDRVRFHRVRYRR